jgi:large subunit ribosomal protein L17
MLRNLIASLLLHRRIRTTVEKAKAATPIVGHLVTLARRGTLADRRRAAAILGDRIVASVSPDSDEPPVKKHAVAILFNEIGPKLRERSGGYTRIVRLSKNRLGDNASQAFFEFVLPEEEIKPADKKAAKKEKKTPAETK